MTSTDHRSLEALIQFSVRLSGETLTDSWTGNEMIRGDHGMTMMTEELEVGVSMAMFDITVPETIGPEITESGHDGTRTGSEERRIEETVGAIIVVTQNDIVTWIRIVPYLQDLWRYQGQVLLLPVCPLLHSRLL